ncbi:MAG: DUF2140 family protein [Planctomycetaceae bacterium]
MSNIISDDTASDSSRPATPRSTAPSPRRRWLRWLWLLLPVLVVTLFGVGYLLVAIRREPEFYRESRAALADVAVREAAVEEFTQRTEELSVVVQRPQEWRIEFTEQQINAWLLQELPKHMSAKDRKTLQEPLVDLQPGLVQIGAKVALPQYTGVLSLDIQPTILEDESLQLTVKAIRAGDLPIPASRLLTEAMQYVDQSKLPVEIETEPEFQITIPLQKVIRQSSQLKLIGVDLEADRLALRGQGAAAR